MNGKTTKLDLSCPKGKILRSAYTRKQYTRKDGTNVRSSKVSAKCIKDLGNVGKGKKLFTLKKGGLTKFNYSLKSNDKNRISSLKKASKTYDKGTLVKKLNALYILHKNTHPSYSKKARSDMKWVQKNM